MKTRIDNLSECDEILLEELNRCTEAHRCAEIAEEAEDARLVMEANRKCIRLYRQDEYSVGLL